MSILSEDNDGGAVYPILKIEIHDKYNKDGMENSDLALLKTESVIEGVSDGNLKLVNGVEWMINLFR